METYRSILNIIFLLAIIAWLRYAFLRIKYLLSYEKSAKQSFIELFLGTMWLPISIEDEVDNKAIKKIKSLNFGLKIFYLLSLILFLLMLIYAILVEFS